MSVTREQIVQCAREYLGAKFVHQGRMKGVGVDCVGLVLCVAWELALVDRTGQAIRPTDYTDYSAQPAGTFVNDVCIKRLLRKSPAEIKPGDVVSMRVPVEPVHVGIISSREKVLYLIHAYNSGPDPKVIEHRLDDRWRRRIVGAFAFPGVV